MDCDLLGKVVLVSGGSSNLGRSICRAFLDEGATVVCTWATQDGRERAQALCDDLPRLRAVRMDVTDEASVAEAIHSIETVEGRLDVLVNNSGVFTVCEQEQLCQEDWDTVFDTNIKGMWRTCRLATPMLKASKDTSIINVASINAMHPGFGGTVHYDASKGAVSSYTASLAVELGPSGIRVNAVAPGLLDAPYLHDDNPLGRSYEERAVLGRMVTPQDVASTVVFLAGSSSSAIVGQTIVVDCGYLLR